MKHFSFADDHWRHMQAGRHRQFTLTWNWFRDPVTQHLKARDVLVKDNHRQPRGCKVKDKISKIATDDRSYRFSSSSRKQNSTAPNLKKASSLWLAYPYVETASTHTRSFGRERPVSFFIKFATWTVCHFAWRHVFLLSRIKRGTCCCLPCDNGCLGAEPGYLQLWRQRH